MTNQQMKQLRKPAEESLDLYPGLVVHDGRKGGSITSGRSRLPLWCLIPELAAGGFPAVQESRDELHGLTEKTLNDFLCYLLEQRGEFARLLLVLADVERIEYEAQEKDKGFVPPWWEDETQRERVKDALRRCLECLR